MEREILHVHLPALPLQVLMGKKSGFADRPAALLGSSSLDARLLSVNPRAVSEGVRRGMSRAEASRRCRRLEFFTPRPDLFHRADRAVHSALSNWSPAVERTGGGYYLDLTGSTRLLGPPLDAAAGAMRELDSRFGLVSRGGVGGSKLIGRAASSVVQGQGLAQVMHFEEAGFLGPFPVGRMLAGEPWLRARLEEVGVSRMWDLQRFSLAELVDAFGSGGYRLYQTSRGIDLAPVTPTESLPELDLGETLVAPTNDRDELGEILWQLSERLGRKTRERKTAAAVIRLLLVYRDGKRVVRRKTLKRPTAFDREVHAHAVEMLEAAMTRRVQVTYLGLRASRLAPDAQPDLFGERESKERLYRAIDEIRQKFGAAALRNGTGRLPAAPAQ